MLWKFIEYSINMLNIMSSVHLTLCISYCSTLKKVSVTKLQPAQTLLPYFIPHYVANTALEDQLKKHEA